MNQKLNLWFRAALIMLAAAAAWTVWAAANDPTNRPPVSPDTTSAAATFAQPLSQHTEDVLTFGLNRVAALQTNLFGQPLWKYLASIVYILLALYSSRAINWVVTNRLRKWAARTQTRFDDLLIEVVHGPIKVVSFVIFLHIGLRLISWSPWVAEYLSKGLRVIVAWSVTYMILKAIDLLLSYWKQRAAGADDKLFSEHLFPVIRKTTRVLIILGAVLLTADNLGFKVTSVLAGLSIGGLALGLAAQDTVANLFGAVAIFLDKPFQVGNRIQVDAVDGVVESIGLRSTRVRNLDGHLVTIPNKTMGNATITNVSARPSIKTVMTFGITYNTPPDKISEATRILQEIYRAHPLTTDLIISFNKFADFSLNITVIHWWGATDYKAYLAGMQELNLKVKERFDAAGIEFAFPTQTLYLKPEAPSAASPIRVT